VGEKGNFPRPPKKKKKIWGNLFEKRCKETWSNLQTHSEEHTERSPQTGRGRGRETKRRQRAGQAAAARSSAASPAAPAPHGSRAAGKQRRRTRGRGGPQRHMQTGGGRPAGAAALPWAQLPVSRNRHRAPHGSIPSGIARAPLPLSSARKPLPNPTAEASVFLFGPMRKVPLALPSSQEQRRLVEIPKPETEYHQPMSQLQVPKRGEGAGPAPGVPPPRPRFPPLPASGSGAAGRGGRYGGPPGCPAPRPLASPGRGSWREAAGNNGYLWASPDASGPTRAEQRSRAGAL